MHIGVAKNAASGNNGKGLGKRGRGGEGGGLTSACWEAGGIYFNDLKVYRGSLLTVFDLVSSWVGKKG